MLESLRQKNPDINIYSVTDDGFKTYGRVIKDLDPSDIVKAAKSIPMPETGSSYSPSQKEFEALETAGEIKDRFFGTLDAQIGYCYGHSNFLNAAEWHFSSELNIAVTPLVLILAHVWQLEDGKLDSSDFKVFYLPEGTVAEVYSTTLHFCPCEVKKEGFGCVVGLPTATNTPLTYGVKDPMLFRRNKWIIAHNENEGLLSRGVVAGISGTNIEIKY